jgi:hypothetical protein
MITAKGKNIIAKYLIGQTSSYASYIAVGCGPKPVDSDVAFTPEQRLDFSQKTELGMEMFRIPVISRGFIVENDTAEITGAIPFGETITYSAKNIFSMGQKVTITGVTPEAYNAVDALVIDADEDTFTISTNVVSVPWVSGGVAAAKVSKIVLTAEMPTTER